ncbi:hypothetical protein BpHYR1_030271 [Brachionus plicatilis]|uniref:Uncharacterized protein n=1 Tax=Brachionus plicatilis TaxID=10195 RepID=A0A3M7QPX0_BRAPC|nr:hypothetical protein BpHYR1_030271 [Brachionus plicatilis]
MIFLVVGKYGKSPHKIKPGIRSCLKDFDNLFSIAVELLIPSISLA